MCRRFWTCLPLAAAQDKDPDLQFIKELLRDHDVRPPWDIVREDSAEDNILWTQFHRRMSYTARGKRLQQTPQWQVVAPQASQIPDFQGMPPSRHGCPSGSSEDCCPDKETILLA